MTEHTQTPHDAGRIRVGIGGWTFEPWRGGNFYPKGLPQARELHHASRALTAIEINGTYYSTFTPSTFAKWHDETPDDFVFSMKANRFATNRRVLAEAGPSIGKFVDSGVAQLRGKLGPIVWQFMPTKAFDRDDFAAFLRLLPREAGGRPLRHALDVRHASFCCEAFVDLARAHGCAIVFTESADYPRMADASGDFVYARVMRTQPQLPRGVTDDELAHMAACARVWAQGGQPGNLPVHHPQSKQPAQQPAAASPRDVFVYFISGAKERAPAAAQALIAQLAAPA